MSNKITLDNLPIESLKQQLQDSFEEVADALQVMDNNWKRLENFGKLLIAAKAKVPHGEWEDFLTDTFQGRLQLRTAQRWISDAKFPEKAEARRAKDREAKAAKATDLSLLKSDEPKASVEVVDPDPPPAPPTNRKTAKGSEKVPEDKKPRTAAIVPEIVDEPKETFREEKTLSDWCEHEILEYLVTTADDAKRRAKALRKAADKLDPPKNGTIPTVEEVAEYAAEKGWTGFNAEKFWNHYDLADWKYGKAKTPLKKWKTAAASAWENGHGWASSTQNGKAQNNGHSNGRTDGSCLGSNGRPEVQKRKIIYK